MNTLKDIATGWYLFIKGSEQTKELMKSRLEVCDACPEKVQLSETGQQVVHLINKAASIYKCGQCMCPLAAKTAGPDEICPLNKW